MGRRVARCAGSVPGELCRVIKTVGLSRKAWLADWIIWEILIRDGTIYRGREIVISKGRLLPSTKLIYFTTIDDLPYFYC